MSMHNRIFLASLLLAGATGFATASAAATVVVHHAAAHPHIVVHAGPRVGIHPGFRPGWAHGVARFPHAGFHPLHAALIGHVGFAHFTPAQRAVWTHGRWYHRWWNGRYGWWWNAGGAWFWYNAPVYPYPTEISSDYYEEPENNAAGPSWYYCSSPPGYYPYVPNCYAPWQPVPAQGYGYDQGGPDQGPPPGAEQQYDNEQGPPPGYDEQGPPPGAQGAPNSQQEPQ